MIAAAPAIPFILALNWILGVAIAALLVFIERMRPGYIEVNKEFVSFRGHFFWSKEERLEYSNVLRFEYRRFNQGRNNSNIWIVVAVLRSARADVARVTLPVLGRRPFARLKVALAEWQSAHGCLEQTAFAEFAEDVRV